MTLRRLQCALLSSIGRHLLSPHSRHHHAKNSNYHQGLLKQNHYCQKSHLNLPLSLLSPPVQMTPSNFIINSILMISSNRWPGSTRSCTRASLPQTSPPKTSWILRFSNSQTNVSRFTSATTRSVKIWRQKLMSKVISTWSTRETIISWFNALCKPGSHGSRLRVARGYSISNGHRAVSKASSSIWENMGKNPLWTILSAMRVWLKRISFSWTCRKHANSVRITRCGMFCL